MKSDLSYTLRIQVVQRCGRWQDISDGEHSFKGHDILKKLSSIILFV